MNIELRSLSIHDRLSQETVAFTASLYIDKRKVGYARNSGEGGPTDYGPDNYHDNVCKSLIKEAEDYCKSLAALDLGEYGKIPMNMEHYIDQLVDDFWQEKENKRFKKTMAIHEIDSILTGVPGQPSYTRIKLGSHKYKPTIANALETEAGRTALKNYIVKIKTELTPPECILNKNIPDDLL